MIRDNHNYPEPPWTRDPAPEIHEYDIEIPYGDGEEQIEVKVNYTITDHWEIHANYPETPGIDPDALEDTIWDFLYHKHKTNEITIQAIKKAEG